MEITKITKDQWIKILKAGAYLVISTLLSAIIVTLQDKPELFGVYTPVINLLLVTVKQAFTKGE